MKMQLKKPSSNGTKVDITTTTTVTQTPDPVRELLGPRMTPEEREKKRKEFAQRQREIRNQAEMVRDQLLHS